MILLICLNCAFVRAVYNYEFDYQHSYVMNWGNESKFWIDPRLLTLILSWSMRKWLVL